MEALTQIFLEFRAEPRRLRLIVEAIAETVEGSFLADKSTRTKDEEKRRIRMCGDIFMELYKDCRWATVRCLDELPKALRCKLDGIDWSPTREGRSSWAADNGRDLIWLPGK